MAVVQQRRKLRIQISVLHDVVIERADGAHQIAAMQQRHRRRARRHEGEGARAADEQSLRAEVLAGLQQALAGKLLAAKAARVPFCWYQMDDELAGKQHDGEVARVAGREYELAGGVGVQLAHGFKLVNVGV